VGQTVGTGSPWRRSPDLKDLILLDERLPEQRGQDLVHVGEFVEGALQERALHRLVHDYHRIGAMDGRASWPAENGGFDVLRREPSIPHTMLRCRPLLRRGHWIQRYRMMAMLKKNVRPSATVTSCMEHLSSARVSR
jgi:hypothetical protein